MPKISIDGKHIVYNVDGGVVTSVFTLIPEEAFRENGEGMLKRAAQWIRDHRRNI